MGHHHCQYIQRASLCHWVLCSLCDCVFSSSAAWTTQPGLLFTLPNPSFTLPDLQIISELWRKLLTLKIGFTWLLSTSHTTNQRVHEPYSEICSSLSSLNTDWFLSILTLILFIQMFTGSYHLFLHFKQRVWLHRTPCTLSTLKPCL